MGVDWIPCRVEADCEAAERRELVQREALHFRTSGSSMAAVLDRRIRFSDAERESIRQAYSELGPLHRRLLLKSESHRVAVIRSEVLFPIEWRIDAERTILPAELCDQLAEWDNYRDAVKQGLHRPFLEQLRIYHYLHEWVTVDLANLADLAQHSKAATSSWATRPAVVACREEVLAAPVLTLPAPPEWPSGTGESDPSTVERAFARIEWLVSAWNDAVPRRNLRLSLPKRPLPLEQWIAARLNDEWYSSFVNWLEPWKSGGYGLYRDCE
jgi:hypothetical protein